MSLVRRLLLLVGLLLAAAPPASGEIRVSFEMLRDPEIHLPEGVKVFSKRLLPLWRQALARPDADMQRMAADAIGRAHEYGFPDMAEAVPALVEVLASPVTHPAARLAAAQTLVTLDARQASPQMAAAAQKYGADLRQVVEPVLARWKYVPQRELWRARLVTPGVRHRDLVLAIRCLAAANDDAGGAELLAIVHDSLRPPNVRLEAARAAGLLRDRGLESDARRLIAADGAPPLLNRLCAVKLIATHAGDEAQQLLLRFGVDEEPAVAVVALTRLIEIDPHLVLPLAERAMASPDAKVRQRGADAYVLVPDAERAAALARLLDDPHPGVRSSVRESLFTLARQPELDDPIRRAATGMLAGDRWRGLEQAALLLAALDHKPAAPRFVELLDFHRAEVRVVAAWALKTLAVPATLPALLEWAVRQDEIRRKSLPEAPGVDEQTAHLFEAFGRMKHAAAERLLRTYVPKNLSLGERSRAAAVWSLGLLHEGVPDEPLARQLMERVADDGGLGIPSEIGLVKQMSAASIGRMLAVSQAGPLRTYHGPATRADPLGLTIRWALKRLTGEELPEPPLPRIGKGGWFLEPLDD